MAGLAHTTGAGRAHVVVLAGGMASGKSTVAARLAERGAVRVDLDALSREACAPGSDATERIARAFGTDVLDASGALRRAELARRAFATPESARTLEAIVHPAVRALVEERVRAVEAGRVCVVEVPLLDRAGYLLGMADEVLCVTCPLEVRRERARLRGVDGADFGARVSRQPDDAYLVAHATCVLPNDGDQDALRRRVDAWWDAHGEGWGNADGHA